MFKLLVKIFGSGKALGIILLLMRAVISDLVFGECAGSARGVRKGVREGPGITSLLMRAVISELVRKEGAGSARPGARGRKEVGGSPCS